MPETPDRPAAPDAPLIRAPEGGPDMMAAVSTMPDQTDPQQHAGPFTDDDGDELRVLDQHLCAYGHDGATVSVHLGQIGDPVGLARAILAAAGSTARVVEGALGGGDDPDLDAIRERAAHVAECDDLHGKAKIVMETDVPALLGEVERLRTELKHTDVRASTAVMRIGQVKAQRDQAHRQGAEQTRERIADMVAETYTDIRSLPLTDPDAGEEAAQDGAMCGHTMAINDERLVCKRPPHSDTDHAAAGWLRETDLECGHAVPGLLDGETLTCVRAPHDDEQHRADDGTTWTTQADDGDALAERLEALDSCQERDEEQLTDHEARIHRAEQAIAALERIAALEQQDGDSQ